MSEILLSIVVPTKNRTEYLKALINIIVSFENDAIELVIEDNSDNNTDILNYLKTINLKNIVYNYEKEPLSVVENSDRAIKHSRGKYITFIGDDDFISKYAYDFVKLMDIEGYESAIFQAGKYYWPGIEFKAHKFPSLIMKKCKAKVKHINAITELKTVLRLGACSLGMLPKVYHGIVLRNKRDEIYTQEGTYFPGPSPDMANAVALALVVKRHIFCDLPLIVAGASPKSTAGLGVKHKHEGYLKDISFLPKDIEKKWEQGILKVWTGPTIYAQSALSALNNTNNINMKHYFNYNYHYAYVRIFCSNYKQMLAQFNSKNLKYNAVKYYFYCITIFMYRIKIYLYNKIQLRFRVGVEFYDNISSTIEANKCLDAFLELNKIQKILKR